jgi:hypothetical protein
MFRYLSPEARVRRDHPLRTIRQMSSRRIRSEKHHYKAVMRLGGGALHLAKVVQLALDAPQAEQGAVP